MSETNRWSARRQIVVGMTALTVLVVGVGGWATFASIAGAIISTGAIEVEGNRQVVQHPEGGVVGEILVNDGDAVEAGDVLLRFDDTLLRSELAIVEGQLYELMARRGRLNAERDSSEEITFDTDLLDVAKDRPEVADLIDGQKRLFVARRVSRASQASQLNERKQQIRTQIGGAEAQGEALSEQLDLIEQELADQQSLLDRGLAQASRVLSLQREKSRLAGSVGELQANIAQSHGQITEIEIEILKLESDLREEAITTLRDLQYRELELSERRLSTLETLSRMDVRAPASGIIYGKQIFALRSVVRAADPLMYVIPQDIPLIITSRIETIHIDNVRVGQPATLVFSTFDQRTTPELFGTVINVSADVFTDEQTGISYYRAELLPNEGEMDKLADLVLLPGMPVESFIKTDERTPLNYLLKPLTDYFNKAFRET